MSNIIVIGPGSVGLGLAVLLSNAGHEVVMRGRAGNVVRGRLIAKDAVIEAVFSQSDDHAGAFAILAVKAYDLSEIDREYHAILQQCKSVLCLQNGLGILEKLPGLPNLLQGILWVSAERKNREEAFWHTPIRIVLDRRDPRTGDIGRLLQSAGVKIEWSENFNEAIFKKLVVNIALNTVTAIYRIPNSAIPDHKEAYHRAITAANETKRIAEAMGIHVELDPAVMIGNFAKARSGFRSSTLQDVDAGKPLEVEALLEEPLRRARKYGVEAPEIQRMYEDLKKMEARE